MTQIILNYVFSNILNSEIDAILNDDIPIAQDKTLKSNGVKETLKSKLPTK